MIKYILIVLIYVSIISCSNNQKVQEMDQIENSKETFVELTDEQLKNTEIIKGRIEQRMISSLLRVNGKIEVPPQNMVSVSVPMGGYLRTTKLLSGMHVRKGEIIATMDDQQYIQLQQDFLTAKIQFMSIEAEFKRQREMNESKASSDKMFQHAQTEYLSQKVLIKSLSEKLKLIGINPELLNENTISKSINLTSPIDGYVSSVHMNIGKYITPTDVLFELVNPTDIHLTLTIFERDLYKLSIGQKIFASNNINPDKKYICEIILIGKDVTPERTIQVQCHFQQYDKSLIPGMYMNAEIEVSTDKAFVIQNEGIVRFEGKQYVFSEISKNKFEIIEVMTRNSENGFTQIIFSDSLNVQDKDFVIRDAYSLLMKMKNIQDDE